MTTGDAPDHRFGRIAVALVLLAMLAVVILPETAAAQAGPFGVGSPEAGAAVPAGGIFGWVAAQQSAFYRALTAGLRAMRAQPGAGWWLVGLSFGYGVFHAAGPGHGKAVITSYVLASDETLRRGIVLAFVSALFQGAVAIVFVGLAVAALRLTALEMTDATTAFERTSAAAILGLGLWLAWTKIVAPLLSARRAARAEPAVASEAGAVEIAIGAAPGGPAGSAIACGCGEIHAPDPTTLAGPFDWKRAVTAIVAVGIRPCTGALIVLVFAFAQGLVVAGVLSVVAMAIGTGTTVAALAALAVGARGLALRFAGDDGDWSRRVVRGAEVIGALIVLSVGVLLAGAAVVGGPVGG